MIKATHTQFAPFEQPKVEQPTGTEDTMAPKRQAFINVDLGEGYGNFKCGPDDELIPMIDHANIACGFHAGSARLPYLHMRNALRNLSPDCLISKAIP